MFHQTASQYGTFGDTSYALDLDYHHNNGVRVNNGLDNVFWNTTVKQQVTSQDTVMLLLQYEDYQFRRQLPVLLPDQRASELQV